LLEREENSTAAEFIIYLAAAAIIFALISIFVINSEVHNLYASGYYTTAALFDAVGFDQSGSFISLVQPFSEAFYAIVAVSILDGTVKMVVIGFVLAALVDMITTLDLRTRLSGIASRNMKDHYVLCGYSNLTDRIVKVLDAKHEKFVVVENDQAKIDMMREADIPCLKESYTTATGLASASVQAAKAAVFLGDNDYENMLGIVTARSISNKLKIVTKAESTESTPRMHSAGADFCIEPEVLSGLEMGEVIARNVSA